MLRRPATGRKRSTAFGLLRLRRINRGRFRRRREEELDANLLIVEEDAVESPQNEAQLVGVAELDDSIQRTRLASRGEVRLRVHLRLNPHEFLHVRKRSLLGQAGKEYSRRAGSGRDPSWWTRRRRLRSRGVCGSFGALWRALHAVRGRRRRCRSGNGRGQHLSRRRRSGRGVRSRFKVRRRILRLSRIVGSAHLGRWHGLLFLRRLLRRQHQGVRRLLDHRLAGHRALLRLSTDSESFRLDPCVDLLERPHANELESVDCLLATARLPLSYEPRALCVVNPEGARRNSAAVEEALDRERANGGAGGGGGEGGLEGCVAVAGRCVRTENPSSTGWFCSAGITRPALSARAHRPGPSKLMRTSGSMDTPRRAVSAAAKVLTLAVDLCKLGVLQDEDEGKEVVPLERACQGVGPPLRAEGCRVGQCAFRRLHVRQD